MTQVPDALLEDLTPDDRHLLDRKLNRRIIIATAIFVPAILAAFIALYVFNTAYKHRMESSVLGFINLFLVILGALAGRIYVAQCIAFFKDKNAFQKRVYRGIVTEKDNGRVKINNHQLRISKEDAALLQKGERAEIHLSIKSGILLNIKTQS
jgi:hypothetical protein